MSEIEHPEVSNCAAAGPKTWKLSQDLGVRAERNYDFGLKLTGGIRLGLLLPGATTPVTSSAHLGTLSADLSEAGGRNAWGRRLKYIKY